MRVTRHILCAFLAGTIGISGALADGGGSDEIRIGSSLPLGGPMGYLGLAVNHGFEAYLRSINEAGGISGKRIRLIAYNDGNDPVVCVRNTRKLIEQDRVVALTCYVGTASALRAQAVWTEARVPAVGIMSGAEVLRVPFNRYTIHVRASSFQETAALVDALCDKKNFKRIAVVYQNDASGDAVRRGTERALQKHGLRPVRYVQFEAGAKDLDAAILRVKTAYPEAVIVAGTYLQFSTFIKRSRKLGLRKAVFCTVSNLGSEAFARRAGGGGGPVRHFAGRAAVRTVEPVSRRRVPDGAEKTLSRRCPQLRRSRGIHHRAGAAAGYQALRGGGDR